MLRRIATQSLHSGISRRRPVVRNETTSIVYTGAAVVGGAIALEVTLRLYRMYKESLPQPTEEDLKKKPAGSSSNLSFFSILFPKNFYEGGFEDKMTKREAALILGVRETSSAERIKDAHRRILLLNHPDRGGSAHLAAKINEAKDLLIKGKQ